jgi:predicted KAP-like P-loop ATPase
VKIRPTKIEIPEDNPFAHDLLKREEYAKTLTLFLKAIDEPCVMALDSSWGTGKTTFILMLEQYLKNEGLPTLYFNAWENDFSDDPFVSLIAEIQSTVEQIKGGGLSKAKKCYAKVQKHGAAFVKSSIPLAVKMATAGMVNEDAVEKILTGFAMESFKKYEGDKKIIKEFKKELENFILEVRKNYSEEKPPSLIFFIDELDRCRPLYAI